MALLFMDGFDDIANIASIEKRWNLHNIDSSDPFIIDTGNGRFSGNAIYSDRYGTYIKKDLSVQTEIIVGFAFKLSSGAYSNTDVGIIEFGSNIYTHGAIVLNNAGKFQWKGSGILPDSSLSNYIINYNTWNYVEVRFKPLNTNGEVEFRINRNQWFTFQDDTANTVENVRWIKLHGAESGNFYYDDVFILNTSGTKNNSFIGDARITQIKPNATGNYAQFTPSSGDNYDCIDDANWIGSDNVKSETNGQMDTHGFEAVASGLGAIKGIQICNGSKKYVETDNTKVKNIIRNNSTDYMGSEIELTDDTKGIIDIYEEDPNDSENWTKAKIDASEFGYQSVI